MFRARFFSAAIVALIAMLVGCGGGGGGLSDPGLSNVQVEVERARAATITPDGGTITATGSNGFVYTLTVPEGAVLQDTKIAIYPITAIKNLSAGASVSGGVNFVPDGLKLSVPATLTIQLPASVDPKQVVPIGYSGNADDIHMDLGTVNGHTITSKVYHFSGTALCNRAVIDLIMTNPFVSDTTTTFQSRIRNLFESSILDRADNTLILRNWYDLIVRPALTAGGRPNSTREEQSRAVIEYYAWLDAILFSGAALIDLTFNVQPENSQSEALAVTLLKRIYQSYNDQCVQNKNNPIGSGNVVDDPLTDAEFAISITGLHADSWHIPRAANGLDKETLLNNLCVKVVIESKTWAGNDGVDAPGEIGTARVKAGFNIAAGPIRHDFPIRVKFSGNGNLFPDPVIINNGALANKEVKWPESVNPLNIDILAALFKPSSVIPGKNLLADLAVFDRITKTSSGGGGGGGGAGGGVTGDYEGTVTADFGTEPAKATVASAGGFVTVTLFFHSAPGTPGVAFTGTLTGSSFHGTNSESSHVTFDGTIGGGNLTGTLKDDEDSSENATFTMTKQ
jgi:hypothetical protein